MVELHEEQAYRRDEIARTRENSARLATVFSKHRTAGQGSHQFKKYVEFGLTYVEEPTVAYGSKIDLETLADNLNIGANSRKQVPLPLLSGMVTDWDTDDRGFYIGCWVAVRVYFPVPFTVLEDWAFYGEVIDMAFPAMGPNEVVVPIDDVTVPVEHFFTFQAVAIKDVPIDLND